MTDWPGHGTGTPFQFWVLSACHSGPSLLPRPVNAISRQGRLNAAKVGTVLNRKCTIDKTCIIWILCYACTQDITLSGGSGRPSLIDLYIPSGSEPGRSPKVNLPQCRTPAAAATCRPAIAPTPHAHPGPLVPNTEASANRATSRYCAAGCVAPATRCGSEGSPLPADRSGTITVLCMCRDRGCECGAAFILLQLPTSARASH